MSIQIYAALGVSAAVVQPAFGFVYYGPLFGEVHSLLKDGRNKEAEKNMTRNVIASIIGQAIKNMALYCIMDQHKPESVADSLKASLVVSGIGLGTILVHNFWFNIECKDMLIDTLYDVITNAVCAASIYPALQS